jgi:hypothetical protein
VVKKEIPWDACDDWCTPLTGRHVRDMAIDKTPGRKHHLYKIAKGFSNLEWENIALQRENEGLKEQLDRLVRSKKRRAVPNPNRRFMAIADVLAADPDADLSSLCVLKTPSQPSPASTRALERKRVVQFEEPAADSDSQAEVEDSILPRAPVLITTTTTTTTRSGRIVKKNRRYQF